MKLVCFGVVIDAIVLNLSSSLMCWVPGNSVFYRADTLHPEEETSLLFVQCAPLLVIMYNSSSECISQCILWTTVKTHIVLPLQFGQLTFCKFIICYKCRRETNTVKRHCCQTRKTLSCTPDHKVCYSLEIKHQKYNEYRSPSLSFFNCCVQKYKIVKDLGKLVCWQFKTIKP